MAVWVSQVVLIMTNDFIFSHFIRIRTLDERKDRLGWGLTTIARPARDVIIACTARKLHSLLIAAQPYTESIGLNSKSLTRSSRRPGTSEIIETNSSKRTSEYWERNKGCSWLGSAYAQRSSFQKPAARGVEIYKCKTRTGSDRAKKKKTLFFCSIWSGRAKWT